MTISLTQTLVDYAVDAKLEDVPTSVVAATRNLLLDTIACIVAGRDMPSGQAVANVMLQAGGNAQATLIGGGGRLSMAAAAYVNGHAANAIDADDTLNYKAHLAAAVVPAALAVGEHMDASGADTLAALLFGYEIAGRIAHALGGLHVDDSDSIVFPIVSGYGYAVFGAAIAAGRLLKLDRVQMHHAFALASASAPISSSSKFGTSLPRPMSKYALYGTIAEAGVNAALLAREGFTGEPDVLDGDRGYWRAAAAAKCDWDALVDRLGERWMVEEVAYKVYPGCRFLASSIDMFLEISERENINPDEVDRIDLEIHDGAIAKKMHLPDVGSMVDACFSVPYLLAASAYAGPPGPLWHSPEARSNSKMIEFARKVHVARSPSAGGMAREDVKRHGFMARMPSAIVVTARGQRFEAASNFSRGDVFDREFSFRPEDFEIKFRNFCASRLSDQSINKALDLLGQFDSIPKARALLDAVSGKTDVLKTQSIAAE